MAQAVAIQMTAHRFLRLLSCFERDDRGAAAIEFAIIAPVLVLGALAAVDFGFAAMERMRLDSALRSAAQSAMGDPGVTTVSNVLTAAASASPPTARSATAFATPTRFCACPQSPSVAVVCSSTCGGASYTYIYYRLEGSSTYTGLYWPRPINIQSTTLVQVR